MRHFVLRKGLDLPVNGVSVQGAVEQVPVRAVALLGADYIGLKPRLLVSEGDVVAAGTPVMIDRDNPTVMMTAPVCGRVQAIHRGARRALVSVVIDVDDTAAEPIDFSSVGDPTTPDGLRARLCQSGLWTSFRTRPYSRVPDPDSTPAAIFVTAIDTEPLAPDPVGLIATEHGAFRRGLAAMALLGAPKVWLCQAGGADLSCGDPDGPDFETVPDFESVEVVGFSGPHPAGLVGTHIHFLDPLGPDKTVWTIGYQDVIAIGRLLLGGCYDARRTVALCGPCCARPRLVQTPAGANLADMVRDDLPDGVAVRLISGSILSGRLGAGPSGYLGRYARQVTIIEEDKAQIPLGWIRPMLSKYAVQPVLGSFLSRRRHDLTSNLNGGRRAMVPTGTFEQLMPQDYLPTQLLRALLVTDTEQAQALGALELDEEDLGLVGFACPSKYEYGPALRECLDKIEKEG